jgi:DNA-binding PadR family transcriptional regulator
MAVRLSNPLALAILASLAERPMHPYEISATLKERGKDQSVRLNFGSLYSVVGMLDKNGLIRVEGTSRDGNRPERTVYAITDEGRAALDGWLSELLRNPAKEYLSLEAGLSWMPLFGPARVHDLLAERVRRLDEKIAATGADLAAPFVAALPRLFVIEAEYYLCMVRAERGFVAALVAELGDHSFPGYAAWQRMSELTAAGSTLAEVLDDPAVNLDDEGRRWVALARESQPGHS